MKHEWMIRVLDDLADYARENGLQALAEHLEQARLLAIMEQANLKDMEGGEEPAEGVGHS